MKYNVILFVSIVLGVKYTLNDNFIDGFLKFSAFLCAGLLICLIVKAIERQKVI